MVGLEFLKDLSLPYFKKGSPSDLVLFLVLRLDGEIEIRLDLVDAAVHPPEIRIDELDLLFISLEFLELTMQYFQLFVGVLVDVFHVECVDEDDGSALSNPEENPAPVLPLVVFVQLDGCIIISDLDVLKEGLLRPMSCDLHKVQDRETLIVEVRSEGPPCRVG